MNQRKTGLLMATVTALSWAVLAIGLKLALKYFSSGTIVWIRLALAALILLIYFSWRRPSWLKILAHPPWMGITSGILIAANYYGFMKGIELTSASNAQIMIQFAPMSFAVLSILLFNEIPTLVQLIGMGVAVMGFGFFYWDQILAAAQNLATFQEGNLWILMAALTWAVFAVLQKILLRKYAPQQFNVLIYVVSTIVLLPTADLTELAGINLWQFILILLLAINTVVAYGALSEALARIPGSHVSMIIAVNPLLTIFIMTLLTQMEVEWIEGEPIHWRGYLGALLVVTGVILTVARPTRLSRIKASPTL